jgi:hypothetical protein
MESDFVSNWQGAIVEQLFWSIRFIPYTWWVLSIFFFPKSVTFFTLLPWTLMAFIIVEVAHTEMFVLKLAVPTTAKEKKAVSRQIHCSQHRVFTKGQQFPMA